MARIFGGPRDIEHEERGRRKVLSRIQHSVRGLPLQRSSFVRLWLGLSISLLGDQFTTIALLWFVLEVTHSSAAVGLVILCFRLPAVVTSPLIGRLLDRYQPHFIMGMDNLLRALLIAAIPVLYWLGRLELGAIYGLVIVAGALAPATDVGLRVVLPRLVSDNELEASNALLSASEQVAMLAGPAVAGVIVTLWGGPPALLFDAVTFLLMGAMLWSLPNISRERAAVGQSAEKSGGLGLSALLRMKEARIIIGLSLVFFFAYGPLEPALLIYAHSVLKSGASGYGLLWSAFGLGALLGLGSIPRLVRLTRPGVTLAIIAVLWGVLLFPLVLITQQPLAMLVFALAGGVWAPYMTIETSLLQRLVPPHLHGRIFGARATIIIAAAPLGAALGGVLLGALSAPAVIGISGLACVVAGIAGLCSPLRSVRRVAAQQREAIQNEQVKSAPSR